jgi:hypothetical protein
MTLFGFRAGRRRFAIPLIPAALLAFVLATSGILAVAAQDASPSPMAGGVTVEPFGTTEDGEEVDLYTLTNANGMVVTVMTYGGIVQKVLVPDRDGNLTNVTLGFETLDEYLAGHPYFGTITGRYANRIARGSFTIEASPTGWRSTMAKTRCTAAWSGSTRLCGTRPTRAAPMAQPSP